MTTPARIILRIPGPWPERIDIITAVATSGTGYLFADDLVHNTRTLQTFPTLVGPYNPQMEDAFRQFSTGNIDDDTLARIGKHTQSLYFINYADSPNDARAAMRAADALLTSGGIAILVESSGVVHTAPAWHALYARSANDISALYEAYVSPLMASASTYYTCGMHNMGLRDAIITGDIFFFEANPLLQAFLVQTIDADHDPAPGDTFPATDRHPAYKITGTEPCTTFPPDNVCHNPNGMWLLELLL